MLLTSIIFIIIFPWINTISEGNSRSNTMLRVPIFKTLYNALMSIVSVKSLDRLVYIIHIKNIFTIVTQLYNQSSYFLFVAIIIHTNLKLYHIMDLYLSQYVGNWKTLVKINSIFRLIRKHVKAKKKKKFCSYEGCPKIM